MGELTGDTQAEFERRLLTEPTLYEELEIAEDELIDEYLSGEMNESDRTNFEQRFLASEERRRKLSFSRSLRKHLSMRTPPTNRSWSLFFNRPVALAAFALIALAVALVSWRVYFTESDVTKGLVALNAAYREQRPLEARISSFSYAPFSVTRSGEHAPVDDTTRDRAMRILLDAAAERPGPTSYHALGRAYLAEKQFDKAIEQFEKAVQASVNDPQLWSDLGAALLEKGRTEQSGTGLETLGRSLENLSKALQLNAGQLEALFNQALCYELMMMPEEAEEAWENYLARDSDSPWAIEARQRLEALRQRKQRGTSDIVNEFVAAYSDRNNEAAWNLIRSSYSSSGNAIANSFFINKGPNADRVGVLSFIGRLAQQRAGDNYYADTARVYALSTPQELQDLEGAHQQLVDAYALFTQSKFDEAIAIYDRAQRDFERLGSFAESVFVQYRIAHSYVLKPDLEKSRQLYERLLRLCGERRYQWLAGQALIGLANNSVSRGEWTRAIAYSKQALTLFEATGHTDGLLRSLIQLSDEHENLNQSPVALTFMHRALAIVSFEASEPMQRWGIYTALGLNLEALESLSASAAYHREALRLALEMQRPLIISRTYAYLGSVYGRQKRFVDAVLNLQQAYDLGARMGAEPNGIDIMGHASLQLGDVYSAAGDYPKAIESYERCLGLYEELKFPFYSYAAHRGKLLAYIQLEDDISTERELQVLLSSLEQYRENITQQSQRNSFFDTQQSVFDAAIEFSYLRRRDQAAFAYAEQSRARTLLDAMYQARLPDGLLDLELDNVNSPLSLDIIQQRMPDEAQLLVYSLLEGKLLFWVLNRTGISTAERDIDGPALKEQITRFVREISRVPVPQDEGFRDDARKLYDLLIQPVAGFLDPNRALCIIPDKTLGRLPFAALISPSGHYLIEDYQLQLAPSASVFIHTSELAAKKAIGEEKVLSVGDPSFNTAEFSSLPRLPAAAREAEEIARYYKSSILLTHERALESRVKAEIEKSDVVHFALHYVADPTSEMLSKLVLAAEATKADAVPARFNILKTSVAERGSGADGLLQAYELYGLKLPRTRLVVLSACQTGIDREYRGEGVVSIARPFLVIGVPLVVASLWPVDSEATAELMTAFHRHRKKSLLSTTAGLQRAQAEMLRGGDPHYRHPYYWAAFVVTGGYAQF